MSESGGPGQRRVVLRGFTVDDFDAVHAFGADIEVTRYTDWGPNTVGDTEAFIANAVAHPNVFAVVLASTGAVIGSAAIEGDTIGYVLHRQFWGQGYATEVALELLRIGFVDGGLTMIRATCHRDNRASARVLEKAGMTRHGIVQHAGRDSWLFTVEASAFDPAK